MRASRVTLTFGALAAAGLLAVGAAGAAAPSSVVTSARAGSVAAVLPAQHAAQPVVAPPAAARPAAAQSAAAPPADLPAKPAAPATPAAPAKPAKPVLVTGTPCSSAVEACVDLSARRAWLVRDGVVVYGPVRITSGRAGYRTPTGTFRVSYKDVDHFSSVFDDAPMPNSVFFNGGVAFHQGSLSVLSHGCIHLSGSASRMFFSSLSPGDVVQVRA